MRHEKLRFSIVIGAPKEKVRRTMLDDEPYREWTSAFMPGSYYKGDWSEGVLDQGYVARRSGHNRGATIDLTIIDTTMAREMDMGTAYDTFSQESHTANAVGEVLWNRGLLVRAMEDEGFENYEREWWHFSMAGNYEPMDVPLGCLPRPGPCH